jgi:hypothetical protein
MADIVNGGDLYVFMNDVALAYSTEHTLSMKMGTRSTANKDSGVWATSDIDRSSVSASCGGLMVYGASLTALLSAYYNRVPVTLEFGEKDTDGTLHTDVLYASGDFVITGLDLTASDGANATYSATFEHYEHFQFTPNPSLSLRIVGYEPVLHDGVTGAAAVFVTGGVEPYTYAWSGGTGPTVAGTNPAWGLNGSAEGVTHTCTVTDSTPVTPLTGAISVILHSPSS